MEITSAPPSVAPVRDLGLAVSCDGARTTRGGFPGAACSCRGGGGIHIAGPQAAEVIDLASLVRGQHHICLNEVSREFDPLHVGPGGTPPFGERSVS